MSPKPPAGMAGFYVVIPDDLNRRVGHLKVDTGRTKADIVRQALQELLAREGY